MASDALTEEQIERLVQRDERAWDELVHRVGRGDAVPLEGGLAKRLLELESHARWMVCAMKILRRSEEFTTTGGPLRHFRRWFTESAVEGLGGDDPRVLPLRLELVATEPGEGGGFAAAQALLDAMTAADLGPALRGEAALLVVKGAFYLRDYAAAHELATRARELFEEAGADERLNFCTRRLAAAELHLGDLEGAFGKFDQALKRRGPLFGGGGTWMFPGGAREPKDEAIDEVEQIATWADLHVPEWIRAVGGLAERWDDPEQADFIWSRFDELLLAALERDGGDPNSDIEVVVRQSKERELYATARRALELFSSLHPDDEWAREQLAVLVRAEETLRLRELLETDADTAIEDLLRLVDEMESAGELGETQASFDAVEMVLDAMLARKDERAIDVQRRLLDHKLAQWGECPAAWFERQNLGTIYAALGRAEEAREAFEAALEHQLAYYGESHPATQMTLRNLERLGDAT